MVVARMPDGVDGQGQLGQGHGARHAVGAGQHAVHPVRGHGGHQVGGFDDGHHAQPSGHLEHHAPRQPALGQEFVHDAAAHARDLQVALLQVFLQRERGGGGRMVLAHQHHPLVVQQAPGGRHHRATARDGQPYLHAFVLDAVRGLAAVEGLHRQADARRHRAQMDAQLRQQQHAHVVGQAQVEIAPRRGRIEALADLDGAFDLAEGLAEAARQAHGLGRGRHAFGRAQQQRVVELGAQPAQRMADGRGGDAQPRGGLAHAAFFHQGLEDHQQVEVDAAQVDRSPGHAVCMLNAVHFDDDKDELD